MGFLMDDVLVGAGHMIQQPPAHHQLEAPSGLTSIIYLVKQLVLQ
jgi:hypothetical protein